jgi:hypothetical protein
MTVIVRPTLSVFTVQPPCTPEPVSGSVIV